MQRSKSVFRNNGKQEALFKTVNKFFLEIPFAYYPLTPLQPKNIYRLHEKIENYLVRWKNKKNFMQITAAFSFCFSPS